MRRQPPRGDVAYSGFLDALVKAAPLDGRFTRRQYMTRRLVLDGKAGVFEAMQAVQYVEANHKDWDMDEEHTWDEWEAMRDGRAPAPEPG